MSPRDGWYHGVSSKPYRGEAIPLEADVTKAADCEAAVQTTLGGFVRLDILINNVGIVEAAGTAVNVDMDAWAQGLEVNVSSMVQMAKHAIPAMQKNDSETRGSIINMGSVTGQKGGTLRLLYQTSKGAAMSAHHAVDASEWIVFAVVYDVTALLAVFADVSVDAL